MDQSKRKFDHLSRGTQRGLQALGLEISIGRKKRGWTQADLAVRAGCSRLTVIAIESGKPTVAIGHVLEVAHMVGLDVFGTPSEAAARYQRAIEADAIFPSRIAAYPQKVDDEF